MPISGYIVCDAPAGLSLRNELCFRSLRFAQANKCLYESMDGEVPNVVFGVDEDGHHGNFHPEVYPRICAEEQWAKRLKKVHTAHKRMRLLTNWQWKELDCANSSDALLMNIFCYPEVTLLPGIRAALGIESNVTPEFGFKPRTPLSHGKKDNTEIDLKLGELLVEAKLTESNFQCSTLNLISRYCDLEAVFDL